MSITKSGEQDKCHSEECLVNTDSVVGILNLYKTGPGFFGVCSTSLLKTLWEKEKLTSNFPFSTVFSTRLENFPPIS